MANALINIARLVRAGFVLARHGVRLVPDDAPLPPWGHLVRKILYPLGWGQRKETQGVRLTTALTKLGPSYIKLGQFLSTRDDIVGRELADNLSALQDRLPPFSMNEARASVEASLGEPVGALFADFGQPLAAASIAQVHKAQVSTDGEEKAVAVKILRPGIEKRFRKDLESFQFSAKMIEYLHPPLRRLRPRAIVDVLSQSVAIEMDLRMEASAISEMAENIAGDEGFRVPGVDWSRSAARVLTLEWIDGTPFSNLEEIRRQGHDFKKLANLLICSFLRHAMRDGFFHADLHQGNLFVDSEGNIVAVDFGIMGRLGSKEQQFLAEILYGFISRNYSRVADVHFSAGYIPAHQSVKLFAQALRAIGEPLMDKSADEISMGNLLAQLFQVTEMFDMETRPELILLQKTMVVVEGVARTFDPHLNMWKIAEPVVREWMEARLGAEGRIHEAAEGAATVGRFVGDIPELLMQAERTATSFSEMAREGLRLDHQTIEQIASAQARQNRLSRIGIWIGALSLAAIALAMIF